MNTTAIKELVEALRSGDYEQGDGYLRKIVNDNGSEITFDCCLGVGCDISGIGYWTDREDIDNDTFTNTSALFYVVPDENGAANSSSKFSFPIRVADYYDFHANDKLCEQGNLDVTEFNACDPHVLIEEKIGFGRECKSLAQCNDDGHTFDEIADAIEYTYLQA